MQGLTSEKSVQFAILTVLCDHMNIVTKKVIDKIQQCSLLTKKKKPLQAKNQRKFPQPNKKHL